MSARFRPGYVAVLNALCTGIAHADNCSALSDCVGVVEAGIIVAVALAAGVVLVAVLPEIFAFFAAGEAIGAAAGDAIAEGAVEAALEASAEAAGEGAAEATAEVGAEAAADAAGKASAEAAAESAVEAGGASAEESTLQTTAHGAERVAGPLATRGGVLSEGEIAAVRQSGAVTTQADGATVRVLQNAAGRYDVVVEGERGIITTVKNVSEKALNRLAGNYGWRWPP